MYCNDGHATQVVDVVAPTEDDQELKLHCWQASVEVADIPDEYVPAAQLMQPILEEAALVLDHVPDVQPTHTSMAVAPFADDHVPARQLMHDDAPLADDHVPTAQLKH